MVELSALGPTVALLVTCERRGVRLGKHMASACVPGDWHATVAPDGPAKSDAETVSSRTFVPRRPGVDHQSPAATHTIAFPVSRALLAGSPRLTVSVSADSNPSEALFSFELCAEAPQVLHDVALCAVPPVLHAGPGTELGATAQLLAEWVDYHLLAGVGQVFMYVVWGPLLCRAAVPPHKTDTTLLLLTLRTDMTPLQLRRSARHCTSMNRRALLHL